MTMRRMSPKELLEASFGRHLPERDIDVGFGHDEREGSIERLGFGGGPECIACPIGRGDRIGPDLAGISRVRERDGWLAISRRRM